MQEGAFHLGAGDRDAPAWTPSASASLQGRAQARSSTSSRPAISLRGIVAEAEQVLSHGPGG